MSLQSIPFVTLNAFQGPWAEFAAITVFEACTGPWMLKQVQHDEFLVEAVE